MVGSICVVVVDVEPDLSLHEPGDGRALPSRPSEKGLELLANDFVEQGLLGFMAFVLDGGKESLAVRILLTGYKVPTFLLSEAWVAARRRHHPMMLFPSDNYFSSPP